MGEPFVRSKSESDESVRDFFIRRIGRQAHDRLVAPALTGIYAGNTANLSMAAVFPRMIEMEREYGSLTRAFFKGTKGRPQSAAPTRPKPKGSVFSFPDGVETLPRRLAEQVSIRYEVSDARIGEAAVTVLAVPAYSAATLVEARNQTLAGLLRKVEYAPMVVAAVSFGIDDLPHPLRGFGFLAAREQGLHLLGALYSSALFAGRAPAGQELLTCFLGGTFEPEAIGWPDERVWETVSSETRSALGASGTPEPVTLFRQPRAIPQYGIGHQRWVAGVKDELMRTPGLFLTGNYLEGVSLPSCIEQGDRTARAVADYLGRTK
jgi:oxygen-dependent protoporphyrinogen oxidase